MILILSTVPLEDMTNILHFVTTPQNLCKNHFQLSEKPNYIKHGHNAESQVQISSNIIQYFYTKAIGQYLGANARLDGVVS